MATVGQSLTSPEAGWKRYDDADPKITYVGSWLTGSDAFSYLGSRSYTSTIGSQIKFNFTGTKIRLISYCNSSAYAANIELKIDNTIFTVAETYSAGAYQVIVFENLNLANIEHSVIITSKSTKYSGLDAIDIGSDCTLKIYNTVITTFLLKQYNNYYSIKSEYYDSISKTYMPLTLNGGFVPNSQDVQTSSFMDINDLDKSITVNSETFKPIDKLAGQFEIKTYKRK